MNTREHNYPTHTVTNQVPPMEDYNVFLTNPLLANFVRNHIPRDDSIVDYASWLGRGETFELARLANAYSPVLKSYDRIGNRIDRIDFHPAYHQFMEQSIRAGMANYPTPNGSNSHLRRGALLYLASEVEPGHCCPISMTYASVPVLDKCGSEFRDIVEKLREPTYQPDLGSWQTKTSLTCGMAMTEKQGGSDVRANTTHAENTKRGFWYVTGHKWFVSAPMSDIFLTLAQTDEGLSAFLIPRVLPDGTLNRLLVQRLKDKIGNRSNASSEIEFLNAHAYLVGEEVRGVKTIIDMVGHCRLDSMIGSAGQIHFGVAQAIHHTRHRAAFGTQLIEKDLMLNVLSDMALESSAATLLSMRLALADDLALHNPEEAALRRIGVALGKFYVCKREPALIAEALECIGGSGYVEEAPIARMFRESPLNGIWEGSGNVNALDTLRAMEKDDAATNALIDECRPQLGNVETFDAAFNNLLKMLTNGDDIQWRARSMVEYMAKLLQGSVMLEYAPPAIAELYCNSRLSPTYSGSIFGTLDRFDNPKKFIDEFFPEDNIIY